MYIQDINIFIDDLWKIDSRNQKDKSWWFIINFNQYSFIHLHIIINYKKFKLILNRAKYKKKTVLALSNYNLNLQLNKLIFFV